MNSAPRILLAGTADTKSAGLLFLRESVEAAGGLTLVMDIGVLGTPPFAQDFNNLDVAAAGTTPAPLAALGDENAAMARMAEGTPLLAARACAQDRIDSMLALGGTMGTDPALDVASACDASDRMNRRRVRRAGDSHASRGCRSQEDRGQG